MRTDSGEGHLIVRHPDGYFMNTLTAKQEMKYDHEVICGIANVSRNIYPRLPASDIFFFRLADILFCVT
mgnify:FL=1